MCLIYVQTKTSLSIIHCISSAIFLEKVGIMVLCSLIIKPTHVHENVKELLWDHEKMHSCRSGQQDSRCHWSGFLSTLQANRELKMPRRTCSVYSDFKVKQRPCTVLNWILVGVKKKKKEGFFWWAGKIRVFFLKVCLFLIQICLRVLHYNCLHFQIMFTELKWLHWRAGESLNRIYPY